MSHHLVHIMRHGSTLRVDRGCLLCTSEGQPEKRIPYADVLAVIVAARGVTFSSDCLSRLMESGAVILHCDEKYKPVGKTIGLPYTIHSDVFDAQIARQGTFSDKLWEKLLRAKLENQAAVLDAAKVTHKLREYLEEDAPEEGNSARHYWSAYFPLFGRKAPKTREHREAENPVNQQLNYSYAVMSAILHRSMVAHGLNPQLGVHHKFRFKSEPLLYDLLEPWRPVCDFLLLRFRLQNPRREISEWVKFVAQALLDFRITTGKGKSINLLNAADRYISSVADCFAYNNKTELFVPALSGLYFEKRTKE